MQTGILEFVDAYFEQLFHKQKLMFLSGFCGIIVLLLLFSQLFSAQKKQQAGESHTVAESMVTPAKSKTPHEPNSNQSLIKKLYTRNAYQITYPSTWIVTTNPIIGGGEMTTIYAKNPPNETTSEFRIQLVPEKPDSLADYDRTFTVKGMSKKGMTTIDGIAANQYEGILSSRPPMQLINTVFAKGNYVYILSYLYDTDHPDEASQLSAFLQSFHLR